MRPRTAPYVATAILLGCLFIAAAWFAAHGFTLAAAITIALFWQQAAFVGHDAGHNAVTHDRDTDSRIGLLVNACLGIGLSWCGTRLASNLRTILLTIALTQYDGKQVEINAQRASHCRECCRQRPRHSGKLLPRPSVSCVDAQHHQKQLHGMRKF